MSGLKKAKEYDWRDSNMAMIGTKDDRAVKKSSALKEPAWKGCEDFIGTKVWRIEKFQVVPWPEEEYGTFFNGDSYIILHTEEECDKLLFDVHFWIGSNSTQDEYGTAAYKTVELDNYLDDRAVQHREVDKYESDEFKAYFGGKLVKDEGGVESGFNHVEDVERPFYFKDNKVWHYKKSKTDANVAVELPFTKENFYCDDGMSVIFFGDTIFQIRGEKARLHDLYGFSNWLMEKKESARCFGKANDVIFENRGELEAHELFRGAPEKIVHKLIRVRTDKGVDFQQIAVGKQNINASLLDSKDVFLLETPKQMFVWVGKQCSSTEKQNAICYAHTFLQKRGQNPNCAISVSREGDGKKKPEWKEIMG